MRAKFLGWWQTTTVPGNQAEARMTRLPSLTKFLLLWTFSVMASWHSLASTFALAWNSLRRNISGKCNSIASIRTNAMTAELSLTFTDQFEQPCTSST